MRVGVYVDGFNLYHGGREHFGRGAAGWRWLDIRSLAADLIGRRRNWVGASIDRVVYCTARIDGATNESGHRDQDIYLKALLATESVDLIEYGYFAARVKRAPLATADPRGRPILTTSRWPLMVRDSTEKDVPGAQFMVSYAHREEKGSDVNVAAHLLLDTLERRIDAAVVVSNDSDLRLPIEQARQRIPVGTVNPSRHQLAGALRGQEIGGVGRHWWVQLDRAAFCAHQLPDPSKTYAKPQGW